MGILLLPSIRSIAYLNTFMALGAIPNEVILLDGAIEEYDGLLKEDAKYNYSTHFFNLRLDINSVLAKHGPKILKVPTSDINSVHTQEALAQCQNKYFVFTGGGIVSETTLNMGKDLIHAHPGLVPHYRGSTCFYYSILKDGMLGSTAIILEKNIDTGPVITSTKFEINYCVKHDQPLFVDYVLDPFIRSYSLAKVLKMYLSGTLNTNRQDKYETNAYYVMHPTLRHLAINKVNKMFNTEKHEGIFEIQ